MMASWGNAMIIALFDFESNVCNILSQEKYTMFRFFVRSNKHQVPLPVRSHPSLSK